ncbi:MAG: hypothetical protein QME70_04365 [Bacillota bacterium]|nr:hypothetical protein [Bacillota bacterium]
MRPEAEFKAQVLTAVVSGVLIVVVMGVVIWKLTLSPLYLVPVIVAVALWPLSLVFYRRQITSQPSSRPPVLLSVIGWAVISATVLLVNYWEEGRITWAVYPTAGALLWPVCTVLYARLVDYFGR